MSTEVIISCFELASAEMAVFCSQETMELF